MLPPASHTLVPLLGFLFALVAPWPTVIRFFSSFTFDALPYARSIAGLVGSETHYLQGSWQVRPEQKTLLRRQRKSAVGCATRTEELALFGVVRLLHYGEHTGQRRVSTPLPPEPLLSRSGLRNTFEHLRLRSPPPSRSADPQSAAEPPFSHLFFRASGSDGNLGGARQPSVNSASGLSNAPWPSNETVASVPKLKLAAQPPNTTPALITPLC